MAARKEHPRFVQALLSGAGVAVVVLLLRLAPAAKLLELKTRDIRMQLTKPAKGPATPTSTRRPTSSTPTIRMSSR